MSIRDEIDHILTWVEGTENQSKCIDALVERITKLETLANESHRCIGFAKIAMECLAQEADKTGVSDATKFTVVTAIADMKERLLEKNKT